MWSNIPDFSEAYVFCKYRRVEHLPQLSLCLATATVAFVAIENDVSGKKYNSLLTDKNKTKISYVQQQII